MWHGVCYTFAHGLNCCFSEGWHYCHFSLNDILRHSLTSTEVSSHLEPYNLTNDGFCLIYLLWFFWARGRCLIWDATCVDIFTQSYFPCFIQSWFCNWDGQINKYSALERQYTFSHQLQWRLSELLFLCTEWVEIFAHTSIWFRVLL